MLKENFETNVIDTSSSIFPKVFFWMFLGLFATGLISYFTYATGFAETLLTGASFSVILIIELVVVLLFSFLFRKLPPTAVAILFFVYAVINGLTLSVIYYAFEMYSIVYVLFASAILFAVFAFIGSVLKKDISKIGTMLLGVVLVAVIISIINMFIGNTLLDIVIDWVVLIAFFGITAWDMQKIKKLQYDSNIPVEKIHIYGAMELYLDFINIFLRLLSLFGKRK